MATIILISSVHWHFTWQRHHHFASGLAGLGDSVFFVEPLPKRWPGRHDVQRAWGRITGDSQAGLCPQNSRDGVTVVSPRLLPDAGAVSRWINRNFFVPRLALALRQSLPPGPIVILNYLPTRASLALQKALSADLCIYDCAWDWSRDPYSRGLERVERELVAQADLILTDSPHNTERMRQLHATVAPIPHGVDFELFSAAGEPREAPKEPLCAYFGDLGTNVDLDLLREVSQRYPLRIVGPMRWKPRGFAGRTVFTGPVPYERVAEHLRDADVLLLPYRTDPDMAGVLPVKVMECLATGKPTIATRLPGLDEFRELFYLCEGKADYLGTIASARDEEPSLRQARQDLARSRTWSTIVAQVEDLIQTRLNVASRP